MFRSLVLTLLASRVAALAVGSGPLAVGGRSAALLGRSAASVRCTVPEESFDSNKLVVAARKGRIDELEALLAQSVDVNLAVRCTKIPTMDYGSALVWAARQGQAEAVRLLE